MGLDDQLRREVEVRKLTQEEIDYVASQVRAMRNQEGPGLFLWLLTLGRAGATEHRELVESFLYYTSDPEIAEAAFMILTRDWGFVKDYINELKLFLKGVDWDKEGKLRISAAFSAGNYLKQNEDQELCDSLIKIVEDPNESEDLHFYAYSSLPEPVWRELEKNEPIRIKGIRASPKTSLRCVDELLEEAKWGKLTQDELDYVVGRVKASLDREDPDLYTLIYTIGKAEAIEHRKLIESFLYYPQNPNIAYIAFYALVNYMDLLGEYLKEVKIFMKGVEWDGLEMIRIPAISAAGRYLTGFDDKILLQGLIDIFSDTNEEEDIRIWAYEALREAMGGSHELSHDEIDFSIIEQAKLRLSRCR